MQTTDFHHHHSKREWVQGSSQNANANSVFFILNKDTLSTILSFLEAQDLCSLSFVDTTLNETVNKTLYFEAANILRIFRKISQNMPDRLCRRLSNEGWCISYAGGKLDLQDTPHPSRFITDLTRHSLESLQPIVFFQENQQLLAEGIDLVVKQVRQQMAENVTSSAAANAVKTQMEAYKAISERVTTICKNQNPSYAYDIALRDSICEFIALAKAPVTTTKTRQNALSSAIVAIKLVRDENYAKIILKQQIEALLEHQDQTALDDFLNFGSQHGLTECLIEIAQSNQKLLIPMVGMAVRCNAIDVCKKLLPMVHDIDKRLELIRKNRNPSKSSPKLQDIYHQCLVEFCLDKKEIGCMSAIKEAHNIQGESEKKASYDMIADKIYNGFVGHLKYNQKKQLRIHALIVEHIKTGRALENVLRDGGFRRFADNINQTIGSNKQRRAISLPFPFIGKLRASV